MMKVTILKDHSVIKYIQPYLISYIQKCGPENLKHVKPSRKERTAFEIGFGLSSITECMDQLYYSVELIAGFRANIGHKLMNRYDYIIFSIENILFRITSIFDRCLRLTNRIYDIGLPDKECRINTIIKNNKIKGTKVGKCLNELNNFTSEFRKPRNEIAHANCFNDSQLNDMQSFYYLLQLNTPEIEHLRNIFKIQADSYVATKKKEFLTQVIELERLVGNFFTSILPKVSAAIENKNVR
ncbi:MAG: hypothetical protein J7K39_01105 [Bacteroidales bacterium]|nr:hypothetical protein [Bacteroidales bacterium]